MAFSVTLFIIFVSLTPSSLIWKKYTREMETPRPLCASLLLPETLHTARAIDLSWRTAVKPPKIRAHSAYSTSV